jgi:hypothetical protein
LETFHALPLDLFAKHSKFTPREEMRKQKRKGHPATGWPLLQGRIVPTEGKVRQNFLEKSYESKNAGVKRFFLNKCLCFQSVTKPINIREECNNLRQKALENFVSQYF